MLKPIDIAKKLNISTSALRHYEAWGIIPNVPRSSNGYREYTEEHVAYFECIRAMLPGFGMDLVKEVMLKVQKKDIMSAILLINKSQYNIYNERVITEKAIELLESPELYSLKFIEKKEWLNIGEVSSITKVPSTAIRHWERIGLIFPNRDAKNGYRRFNAAHIRQILFIRSLKKTVYLLDGIRQLIRELENNNIEIVREAAKNSLKYFDQVSKDQICGIHSFYNLCQKVELLN
ncbi:MerR family transcriptional regulator [Clostridium sp. AL.422]|uniref:MerR family transcriptional regulator n=1 Tax=Clostridium TaxID=1485 RepID=UPI00293DFE2D|nr:MULTISPECIES: MerR family transcriptional regulator [unclassified Clostridium]MDV4151318.1 MerR family transcriptional regulator [Clostridium sp. AL.422]